MSFTVLAIVATSQFYRVLVGQCVKCRKENVILLLKKHKIVVLLICANHRKLYEVTKHARDFDIPILMLTTILKNNDKIIPKYEAGSGSKTVSGNLDQRTLLILAKLWH